MAESSKVRRLIYLEKIADAEQKAANATDQSTIDGWNTVAHGYRMLLDRLSGSSLKDPKP